MTGGTLVPASQLTCGSERLCTQTLQHSTGRSAHTPQTSLEKAEAGAVGSPGLSQLCQGHRE